MYNPPALVLPYLWLVFYFLSVRLEKRISSFPLFRISIYFSWSSSFYFYLILHRSGVPRKYGINVLCVTRNEDCVTKNIKIIILEKKSACRLIGQSPKEYRTYNRNSCWTARVISFVSLAIDQKILRTRFLGAVLRQRFVASHSRISLYSLLQSLNNAALQTLQNVL